MGTARSLRVEGIDICGKTGTAENYAKIDGKRVKLEDHSIFVAFAPKDNPKIAIAVMVENGGYGATIAGPIASLMIEKYLRKKISRVDLETRVLNISLRDRYAKLGGMSEASAIETTPKMDNAVIKNAVNATIKAATKTTTAATIKNTENTTKVDLTSQN